MYKVATTSVATLRQHTDTAGFTESERIQVLAHLECIFQSAVFRNSKRLIALLRYVVSRALDGQSDQLKERTIGVEAFGRSADYDTGVDHSVRSAAGEVRRRLAQYYMEFGTESGVSIEMPPGSYVPQIRFVDSLPAREVEPPLTLVRPSAPPLRDSHYFGRWGLHRVVAVTAVSAVLVFGLAFRLVWPAQTPFDQLWNPIVASPGTAVLCFGGGKPAQPADPPATLLDIEVSPAHNMNVGDALTLVAVTGALRAQGKPYRILNRANTTSFKDLQQGPFLLIGAMNNEWTLRLMSGLRYTFSGEPGARYIADKQNAGNRAWWFTYRSAASQPARDYAIVTRLRDPMTQQMGLIVAGFGSWGTQAAGEFVSNPDQIRKLESRAPRHWERKNLQVVLATDIINGSAGPPIVLATYFW